VHAPSFSASPRLRRTVQVCQMRRAARRACSSPATSAAAAMSAEPRSVRPTSASASSSRLPPRAPPCHPTLTLTRRCSCAKQRLRPHARTARRPSTTPFARSQRLAHSVRSSGAVRQKRDGGGPGARHVQPPRAPGPREQLGRRARAPAAARLVTASHDRHGTGVQVDHNDALQVQAGERADAHADEEGHRSRQVFLRGPRVLLLSARVCGPCAHACQHELRNVAPMQA